MVKKEDTPILIYDKNSQKTRYSEKLSQLDKNKQTNTKKPTAGIILNGEKVELFH